MTEANRARSARKLGEDVVVPLLVKGDKIRLKDGTRLFYGEGFDTESEPEVAVPAASTDPIPSYGGGRRGMEMRDDPDEQEQIRKLRERGSHTSAPVTRQHRRRRSGVTRRPGLWSLRIPLLGRPLAHEQRLPQALPQPEIDPSRAIPIPAPCMRASTAHCAAQ